MRRTLLFLFSISVLFSIECASAAERRIALVIGNSSYRAMSPRAGARNDAEALATLLRTVGFDVVEGFDLGRDQLGQRLQEFGDKAAGADIALLYYSGQAIGHTGANLIVPVDADIKSESDLDASGARALTSIAETMHSAKVRVLLFDASRNNQFPARAGATTVPAGLAGPEWPADTVIIYATGPGQALADSEPGLHSAFTRALLDNITQPGLELQDVIRKVRTQVATDTGNSQMPWSTNTLVGPVYLNPPQPAGR